MTQKITEIELIRTLNKHGVPTKKYLEAGAKISGKRQDPSTVLSRRTKPIPISFLVTRVPSEEFLKRHPEVSPMTKALNKPALELMAYHGETKFHVEIEDGLMRFFDQEKPAENPLFTMPISSFTQNGEELSEEAVQKASELALKAFMTIEAKLRRIEGMGQVLHLSLNFGIEEETGLIVLASNMDPSSWQSKIVSQSAEELLPEKRAGIPRRNERWENQP